MLLRALRSQHGLGIGDRLIEADARALLDGTWAASCEDARGHGLELTWKGWLHVLHVAEKRATSSVQPRAAAAGWSRSSLGAARVPGGASTEGWSTRSAGPADPLPNK